MTTKHTPGPWHVTEDYFVENEAGDIVAHAGFCLHDEINHANAALIAAAPRLLEALEHCLVMLARVDTSEGVCCCGSPMDTHSITDGHSPVDAGDYYAEHALAAGRAAVALAKGDTQ